MTFVTGSDDVCFCVNVVSKHLDVFDVSKLLKRFFGLTVISKCTTLTTTADYYPCLQLFIRGGREVLFAVAVNHTDYLLLWVINVMCASFIMHH